MQINWSNIRAYNGGAGYQDTSRQAANKINRKLGVLHKEILDMFALYQAIAFTPDEMASLTGLDRQTVKSRFTELTNDGYLFKTGQRGVTIKGSSCCMWARTEKPWTI